MNTHHPRIFAIILLIIVGVAAAARAGVSSESPFMPRGLSNLPTATPSSPIELRGIASDDQGARFAIYDPAKKEGAWVRVDEKGQPFVVRSYDAATSHIVVDYQGRTQTLVLVEPKFGPARPVGAPMPGIAGQAGAAAAGGVRFGAQPGQPGARPQAQQSADEAKRLEAIRAEVARRRAQREAASQQQGQPQ